MAIRKVVFNVLLIPWFCIIIQVLSKKDKVTSASIVMPLCFYSTIFIAETENPSTGVAGHALEVSVIIQLKFLFVCFCRLQTKNNKLFYPISSFNPNTNLWCQPNLCSNRSVKSDLCQKHPSGKIKGFKKDSSACFIFTWTSKEVDATLCVMVTRKSVLVHELCPLSNSTSDILGQHKPQFSVYSIHACLISWRMEPWIFNNSANMKEDNVYSFYYFLCNLTREVVPVLPTPVVRGILHQLRCLLCVPRQYFMLLPWPMPHREQKNGWCLLSVPDPFFLSDCLPEEKGILRLF